MRSICIQREPYGLRSKPFFGINPSTAIPFFDFADFFKLHKCKRVCVCRVMPSIKTAKKHLLVFIKIQVLILPKNQMRSICMRRKPYGLRSKPFFGINPSTAIPFFDFADFFKLHKCKRVCVCRVMPSIKTAKKHLLVFIKIQVLILPKNQMRSICMRRKPYGLRSKPFFQSIKTAQNSHGFY